MPDPDRWFSITPPKKIVSGFYICHTKFELDYLQRLCEEHDYYGGVLLSGREAHFYLINEYECKLLEDMNMHVDKQQKKGGQSAPRIGRLRDDKKHRNCKHLADRFMHHYYDATNHQLKVVGLIVGGPGETKKQVVKMDLFQKYLQKDLIYLGETPEFDTEKGVLIMTDLYLRAKEHLMGHSVVKEVEILQEFWDLQELNSDMLVFGEVEVINGLNDCLLKKVIYGSKLEKCLADKLLDLGEKCGADLIRIDTIEGSRRLDGYGGMIGIKWFMTN